jgi:Phage tail lysozyme
LAGRTVTVTTAFLGNTEDLEASLVRAGIVAEDSSKKIASSARAAGAAAAEQAKQMGASADQQEASAAKAAVAFVEASDKITKAQKAAGYAAADAAKQIGGSVDEQRAAYLKAIAVTQDYEDSVKRSSEEAAAAAKASAAQIAEAAKVASAAQVDAAAKSKAANDSFAKFGGKVLLGVTVGGAASMYEAVKGATKLQSAMEQLHTQAGVTQAGVAKLTTGVLNMATSVGTAPGTLADGMYHVASSLNATLPAATRVSTELAVLKIGAEGAQVGGSDLTDTMNALDAAIVSGISGAQNYKQAMGAMNATVGAGDMKMQDLADAMGTGVVVQAKLAGVSLNRLGGALAVLGDNNIRGARAGTLMASALRIMKAPSEAATEALNAINLSSTSLAQALRSGGVVGALQDLKTHLADSGASVTGTAAQMDRAGVVITRAFGGRQSAGIQDLLGQLDRLKDKTAQVNDGGKDFGADYVARTKTLGFQVDALKATVGELGDKFGLFLIPKLEAVGHATESVIDWFGKHRAAAELLATTISIVLGTAVAAYAYNKATLFVTATKTMIAGMTQFAGKIVAIVPTILTKLGLIGTTAEATAGEVEGADTAIVASAEATAVGVDTAIGSTGIGLILIGLGVAAVELGEHWSQVMSAMKSAVSSMVSVAESMLNNLIGILNTTSGIISTLTGGLISLGKLGNVSTNGLNQPTTYNGKKIGSTAPGGMDSTLPAGTSAGVSVPTSGSNWQRIATALASQGFSKVTIAGILGNFAQETGGGSLSAINTADSGSGASGMGGMGIANWTASRRTAEMSYASSHHESDTSLAAQVGFLVQELRTNYHSTYTAVAAAKTPQQAASIFDKMFEGGTDPGGVRERAAAQAYAALGSSTSAGGSSGAAAGGSGGSASSKLAAYLNGTSSTSNTAATTSTIPVAVATMLSTAQALVGTKYTHGGGHDGWQAIDTLKQIGVDCSGFVSAVLHSGGLSLGGGPQTTAGLAQDLTPGKGKDVTVYDRASGSQAHTLIDILGKWFESGGNSQYNPKGGVTNLTAAQAGGELSGGGFKAYHPIVGGKDATDKQLAALGLSSSAAGAIGSTDMNQLIATAQKAVLTIATTLLTKLNNAIQSGTVRSTENALGASTRGKGVSSSLNATIEGLGTSATMAQISGPTGPVNSAGFTKTLTTALTAVHGKALDTLDSLLDAKHGTALATLVANLTALHGKALTTIEGKLTGSHSKALQGVGKDLTAGPGTLKSITSILNKSVNASPQGQAYTQDVLNLIATGQSKEAQSLVAAHKAAMATMAQEIYAQQILKDGELLKIAATEATDLTKLASDTAAANLTTLNAEQQVVTDGMSQMVTAMKDAQQVMDDEMAGVATAIKDAATINTDQSNSIVSSINDSAQTTVDTLGERGLYGLNLVAQQLQVSLDETKSYWDQQISTDQMQLDVMQAQADAAESAAQINLDQVTAQQDLIVAAAQQREDIVTAAEDAAIASATAHADAVQLAVDTRLIGPAQMAVDMNANATKAQQDVYAAQLNKATGQGNAITAAAQAQLASVTAASNAAIANVTNAYNSASGNAQIAIQSATTAFSGITAYFNNMIAMANATLSGAQASAATAEAPISAAQSITQEEASTQFAGTGTTVNIYGLPADNAADIADALSWVARTELQAT